MGLHPFPALFTSFRTLITPFPVNIFPNIDAPKVPNNIPKYTLSFFISCFTASVLPAINTPEFSVTFQ